MLRDILERIVRRFLLLAIAVCAGSSRLALGSLLYHLLALIVSLPPVVSCAAVLQWLVLWAAWLCNALGISTFRIVIHLAHSLR